MTRRWACRNTVEHLAHGGRMCPGIGSAPIAARTKAFLKWWKSATPQDSPSGKPPDGIRAVRERNPTMINTFVLRASERGHNRIGSTGATSAYVAGLPDPFIIRESSFNFHEYQGAR